MIEAQFIINRTNQLVLISENNGEFSLEVAYVSTPPGDITQIDIDSIPHLKDEVTIIDSVLSGTGREQQKDIYHLIIRPIFELLGVKYDYLATSDRNSVKEIARSIKLTGDKTIIFLSGDTTVSEFINSLPKAETQSDLNIIIIPCGTGNSLSLSLGIDDSISSVISMLQGTKQPLNLYNVDLPRGSYFLFQDVQTEIKGPLLFLSVFSWAFHAAIVADSDTKELRKLGVDRFKVAAMKNLEKEQKYHGSVVIDDTSIEGPFAYWLVTGAKRFEKTFEILPNGDLTNTSMYMVAIDSANSGNLMDIMMEVYDHGSHIKDSRVVYKEILKNQQIMLRLGADTENRFCLDGSIIVIPNLECNIMIKSIGNLERNWRINIIG